MISVKVKVKSSQRAFLFDHNDKPHVCVFGFFSQCNATKVPNILCSCKGCLLELTCLTNKKDNKERPV